MPTKRRIAKRRTFTDADELDAWSGLFDCGYDFFNDLEPFGFPPNRDADCDARAAAGEAWQRLGAAFMRTWQPHQGGRQSPWALEEFGQPKGGRHAG